MRLLCFYSTNPDKLSTVSFSKRRYISSSYLITPREIRSKRRIHRSTNFQWRISILFNPKRDLELCSGVMYLHIMTMVLLLLLLLLLRLVLLHDVQKAFCTEIHTSTRANIYSSATPTPTLPFCEMTFQFVGFNLMGDRCRVSLFLFESSKQ